MKNVSHYVVIALSLSLVPLLSTEVRAQSGLTPAQRKAYAELFQTAPPDNESEEARTLLATDSGGESGHERGLRLSQKAAYARVYRALLDIQERRTALPADPRKLPEYIKATRSDMARLHLIAPSGAPPGLEYLLLWNHLALDAAAQDHSTLSGSFGEQLGPTRTSRALAIVHWAMFEAINAISRKHPSFQNVQQAILAKVGVPLSQLTPMTASMDRAIVEAAYQTLKKLYPEKDSALLIVALNTDRQRLGDIPNANGNRPPKMILGEVVGKEAAEAILAKREFDGSEFPDLSSDDFNSPNPRTWHTDPISKLPLALGGNWPRVKPFAMPSADAFRPGSAKLPVTPPAFESPEFINSYKEVKNLGGDPNALISATRWPTPTSRGGAANPNEPMPADNTNQTFVGIFWGYDGTALLCAPPRLYNMIATSVALKEKPITTVEGMAQYLACINMAMADAGIASWDAKYHFLIPRPVTYIRSLDADGTPEGARNVRWTPLGAPVTNGTDDGRNLTPPFPAYPSGHATFGGALFKTMTLYFKSLDPSFPDDGIAFDFLSDEYNGLNRGPGEEAPRKKTLAHFDSFKQAERLNADSRIYLGIHWQFDADHGIMQGNLVAEEVFNKFVQASP